MHQVPNSNNGGSDPESKGSPTSADKQEFVISDEDIEEANQEIDLLGADPLTSNSPNAAAEPPIPSVFDDTPRREGSNHSVSSSSDYNADNEIDYESDRTDNSLTRRNNYGIALDDELVNHVLSESGERHRQRRNGQMKKYCKYATLVFLAFVAFEMIQRGNFWAWHDIATHGSAFHYNDEEYLDEADMGHSVFDTPVAVSSNYKFPPAFAAAADVRGTKSYQKNTEMPLFVALQWPFHSSDFYVEDIVGLCYDMVIASNKPLPPGVSNGIDSLKYFPYTDEETGKNYVNIDFSKDEHYAEARNQHWNPNDLADAWFSDRIHAAGTIYFSSFGDEHKMRLFTIMTHPVDRLVAEYYHFTQTAVEDVLKEMPFEEFINSKYYTHNYVTRHISACWDGNGDLSDESIDNDQMCLQGAKEVLRTKFIVGTHKDIPADMELFEDYFFWRRSTDTIKECRKNNFKKELDREMDMYNFIGHSIPEGSDLFNEVVKSNHLDMELYAFAVELNKAQRTWIPRQEMN